MDPRLVRLIENGGNDDQVAAIVRLSPGQYAPARIRIVSQFGDIATVRVRRGDIPRVHDSTAVVSMKPPSPLLQEPSVSRRCGILPESYRDIRRPRGQQATGQGIVVGFIDWGFDFAHPDFCNQDGSTRLLALWDQSLAPGPASPAPYGYGAAYTPAEINAALRTPDPYATLNYNPADSDIDGGGTHGTHVGGIAVGNGRAGGPSGIAPNADIVFVQLTTLDQNDPDLADSASVLEAIDFIRHIAGSRPWVVNLSMGQCGDQHDGTTLLEQGLDTALAEAPGCAIAQSAGNYFHSHLHSSGRLRTGQRRDLSWRIPNDGDTNELEVWYPGRDVLTVTLCAPDGRLAGRAALGERVHVQLGGQDYGELHHRRRDPNNLDNHVVLWLNPGAPCGDWKLILDGSDVVDGAYHLWIQRSDDDNGGQPSFESQDANPYFTTNSICNGRRTVVVGAYDPGSTNRDVASFSSAGPTRDGRPKPDLLAPGVDVLSARSTPAGAPPGSGGLVRMTGTSMAAPHVAGTIALMFEAAPRPLRNEETRSLLMASVQPAQWAVHDVIRYGSGYLDVNAAVEAARGVGNERVGGMRPMGSMGEGAEEMPASSVGTGSATVSGSRQSGADGWAGPLAMADTLIGMGGQFAASSSTLLARVLSDFADPAAVDPLAAAGLLDPAMIFDGFTAPRMIGLRPMLDRVFAVLAYPRQGLPVFEPGDLLVRRALGEPGLGHVAFIAGPNAYRHDEAWRRGLALESTRRGYYARVIEPGPHPHRPGDRFGRLVATAEGVLPPDTMLVRPRLRLPTTWGLPPQGLVEDIDVDRAVQANQQYAAQLGWDAQCDQITPLLGLSAGASDQDFAQAVANWQTQNGLTADGMLGPDTWSAMQPQLGAAPTSPPSVSVPTPTATPSPTPSAAVSTPSSTIDVDRAVQANRQYAGQLGWAARYSDIVSLLGLSGTPTDQDFAQAVANWQTQNGLTADGMLGPDTWSAMQPQLGAAPTSPPSVSVPTPTATPSPTPSAAVSTPSSTIDVDRAVQANRQYAGQLGWAARYSDIVSLLGLSGTPTDQDFAQAVADWQTQNGLTADGKLGPDTWSAVQPKLGLQPSPTPPAPAPTHPSVGLAAAATTVQPWHPAVADIFNLVDSSGLTSYNWTRRGVAPIGYLNGMALTYARVYCHYKLEPGEPENFRDRFAVKMAKAVAPGANTTTDAVARFASQLQAFGANLSVDGLDVLRGVFVILFGLGMKESAGKYCTGWDRSKLPGTTPTAENSEAGLFQISYDIGMHAGDFKDLWDRYQRRPDSGFRAVFSDGVSCSASEWSNFGSGPGADFQQFCKGCPAFAVELAALAMRVRANYSGPINRRDVELREECWTLLQAVELTIDDLNGCIAVD